MSSTILFWACVKILVTLSCPQLCSYLLHFCSIPSLQTAKDKQQKWHFTNLTHFFKIDHESQLQVYRNKQFPELFPSWAMDWHFFVAGKDWSQTTVLFNWKERKKNASRWMPERLLLTSPQHKHTRAVQQQQRKTIIHVFPSDKIIRK